jgi:hypothetical protein
MVLSTKFKLPKWMFKPFKNHSLKKHREISYIYDKDTSLNLVLNNTESEYLKSLWSSKVNLGNGTF